MVYVNRFPNRFNAFTRALKRFRKRFTCKRAYVVSLKRFANRFKRLRVNGAIDTEPHAWSVCYCPHKNEINTHKIKKTYKNLQEYCYNFARVYNSSTDTQLLHIPTDPRLNHSYIQQIGTRTNRVIIFHQSYGLATVTYMYLWLS